jgi:nitrogen fixation NifU-like protein
MVARQSQRCGQARPWHGSVSDGGYHDTLLEHYRNPRHFGELGTDDFVEIRNPLCGDVVQLTGEVDSEQLRNLRFNGKGCAICTASASLMCSALQDVAVTEAKASAATLIAAVESRDPPAGPAELAELACLLTVRDFPMRLKCATLPWTALEKLLAQGE